MYITLHITVYNFAAVLMQSIREFVSHSVCFVFDSRQRQALNRYCWVVAVPLPKARQQVWVSRDLGDDFKIWFPWCSRCDTRKNPHSSMAVSAERRSNSSTTHRHGWRLRISLTIVERDDKQHTNNKCKNINIFLWRN